MRDEIAEHLNTNFKINPWHLTYGEGPAGSSRLRSEIASFVNNVFEPHAAVDASHICMCNGVASAVNNFSFCVGEPGDGILISRPLYVGFFGDIQDSAKLKAVLVSMGSTDPLSVEAVQHYETTLLEAEKNGTKIRGILIPNPHNPLGRPYSREALEAYFRLCNKYNIHLLSDEIYAASWFPSEDFPNPPKFNSVLSFDLEKYINPALVHVIYGMSKDFCANGIRVGCLISPFNNQMLKAFKSITGISWASQLAEHVWLNILSDKPFLEAYLPELRRRMTDAYTYTTNELKARGIPYRAASVAPLLWIDLSAYLEEDTVDAELALNWRMAKAGVWLAMGATFASETNGNYRITFATPRKELELGLGRLFQLLEEVKLEKEAKSR
jgi:aspartate/methionine/tyrosine aminotransferase